MRKIFTIISILFLTCSLYAQTDDGFRSDAYNYSRLSISNSSNSSVRLLIDGKSYNNAGNDQDILISEIKPGYHSIKIYLQKDRRQGKRFGNNMLLVFDSRIYLKYRYHTDININRFGKPFVDQMYMDNAYFDAYENSDGDNPYDDHYTKEMDKAYFGQFLATLKKESFDDTRLVLAKQVADGNNFTAVQVKELVKVFRFDDNKLEIAKYVYKNTIDKQNYFMVNEAFSYSSSKEELARYIQSYK